MEENERLAQGGPAEPRARLSAQRRRAHVVKAAMAPFARRGYAATTTDEVARAAGVSQSYVVRIFGSKLALFLDVFACACGQVQESLAAAIAGADLDVQAPVDWARLDQAYSTLPASPETLPVMMQGFAAGDVPEIAASGRAWLGSIFSTLTAAGCTIEQAQSLLANGMLLNAIAAIGAGDEPSTKRDSTRRTLSVITEEPWAAHQPQITGPPARIAG